MNVLKMFGLTAKIAVTTGLTLVTHGGCMAK
jgi:hypothetical protein